MSETRGFCYSRDGERYEGECATREEALEEAIAELDLTEGETVWIGMAVTYEPAVTRWAAASLVERIGEEAYETVGELCEGWPSLTDVDEESLASALTDTLREWIKEHGKQPTFYAVVNSEEQTVPAALPSTPEADQ